ncbi:hypothetical protein PG996_006087 [Apiospora saccharicola]|uniref:Uncharacterized protein n=1 Tax=Apiospora saccharicola TaxID=335842 RepID=A0ABR1VS58_9PEZI
MDEVDAYENTIEKVTQAAEWVDDEVKGMILTNEFNVPAPVDETADHHPMVGQVLGAMLGLMSPNPKRIDQARETAYELFSKPEADLPQILSDVADEFWRLGVSVEPVRPYIPKLHAGPLSAGPSTELLRLVGDFHHPIVVDEWLLPNHPDDLLATLTSPGDEYPAACAAKLVLLVLFGLYVLNVCGGGYLEIQKGWREHVQELSPTDADWMNQIDPHPEPSFNLPNQMEAYNELLSMVTAIDFLGDGKGGITNPLKYQYPNIHKFFVRPVDLVAKDSETREGQARRRSSTTTSTGWIAIPMRQNPRSHTL